MSEIACYMDAVAERSGIRGSGEYHGNKISGDSIPKDGRKEDESAINRQDQDEQTCLVQCYLQWQPLLTALHADFEINCLTGNIDERDGRGQRSGPLHTLLLFAEDPHYAGVHQFLLKQYSAGGSIDANSLPHTNPVDSDKYPDRNSKTMHGADLRCSVRTEPP